MGIRSNSVVGSHIAILLGDIKGIVYKWISIISYFKEIELNTPYGLWNNDPVGWDCVIRFYTKKNGLCLNLYEVDDRNVEWIHLVQGMSQLLLNCELKRSIILFKENINNNVCFIGNSNVKEEPFKSTDFKAFV